MGVVYRAREGASGRLVALKAALGSSDPRRFEREGELVARLDHPHVVKVHARSQLGGRPAYVYELVPGARTLLEAGAGAALSQRIAWVEQAARGLGHAHAQGLVHRDVKPENLLVDEDQRLRVADFGIAGAEDVERLTRSAQLLGTPYYMAPEALEGERAGATLDVWSLGVVLYEQLTGELPFGGANLFELRAQIRRGSPRAPRALRPEVGEELSRVCLRALALSPAERYADGAAFAAALAASRQPAPGPRRRAGALVAALGLGLLALGALLAQGAGAAQVAAPSPSVGAEPGRRAGARSGGEALPEARRLLAAGRAVELLAGQPEPPGPAARGLWAQAAFEAGERGALARWLAQGLGDPAREAALRASLQLVDEPERARAQVVGALRGAPPAARPLLRRVEGYALLHLGDWEGARLALAEGARAAEAVGCEGDARLLPLARRLKLARELRAEWHEKGVAVFIGSAFQRRYARLLASEAREELRQAVQRGGLGRTLAEAVVFCQLELLNGENVKPSQLGFEELGALRLGARADLAVEIMRAFRRRAEERLAAARLRELAAAAKREALPSVFERAAEILVLLYGGLPPAEARAACWAWLGRVQVGSSPRAVVVRALRGVVAARYAELALTDYVSARTAGELERADQIGARLRSLLPVLEAHRAWAPDVWVQSALIPLALGDLGAAEGRVGAFLVERWRLTLRAELALCRGQPARALKLLRVPEEARALAGEPYLPRGADWLTRHARAILAHAYALQGRACPLPDTEGVLIPWRTPARLRAVIEGRCWWPGRDLQPAGR